MALNGIPENIARTRIILHESKTSAIWCYIVSAILSGIPWKLRPFNIVIITNTRHFEYFQLYKPKRVQYRSILHASTIQLKCHVYVIIYYNARSGRLIHRMTDPKVWAALDLLEYMGSILRSVEVGVSFCGIALSAILLFRKRWSHKTGIQECGLSKIISVQNDMGLLWKCIPNKTGAKCQKSDEK